MKMIKVTELNTFFGGTEIQAKVIKIGNLYQAEILFDIHEGLASSSDMTEVTTIEALNDYLSQYSVVIELNKVVLSMTDEQLDLIKGLQEAMRKIDYACEQSDSFYHEISKMNKELNIFNKCIGDSQIELRHYIEDYDVKEIVDGKLIFNNTVIDDIFLDETLRFEVNPMKHYGLTREQVKELI